MTAPILTHDHNQTIINTSYIDLMQSTTMWYRHLNVDQCEKLTRTCFCTILSLTHDKPNDQKSNCISLTTAPQQCSMSIWNVSYMISRFRFQHSCCPFLPAILLHNFYMTYNVQHIHSPLLHTLLLQFPHFIQGYHNEQSLSKFWKHKDNIITIAAGDITMMLGVTINTAGITSLTLTQN